MTRTSRRGFMTLSCGAALGLAAGGAQARPGDDLPNVFFSPHGRPYRAPPGAPYPVADWFAEADRRNDGKLDADEFLADAEAFFNVLDGQGKGELGPADIAFYEHNIAPEILGQRVIVLAGNRFAPQPGAAEARLWLAQTIETPPFLQGGGPDSHGPPMGAPDILPNDIAPNDATARKGNPYAGVGAAPFSFFQAPEPVTSSDPDFVFRGVVRKTKFLERARENFTALDVGGAGYLSLNSLPDTPIQKLLHQGRSKS